MYLSVEFNGSCNNSRETSTETIRVIFNAWWYFSLKNSSKAKPFLSTVLSLPPPSDLINSPVVVSKSYVETLHCPQTLSSIGKALIIECRQETVHRRRREFMVKDSAEALQTKRMKRKQVGAFLVHFHSGNTFTNSVILS